MSHKETLISWAEPQTQKGTQQDPGVWWWTEGDKRRVIILSDNKWKGLTLGQPELGQRCCGCHPTLGSLWDTFELRMFFPEEEDVKRVSKGGR